jgi:hypothetical protein
MIPFLSYLWSRPRLLFPVVGAVALLAGVLVGRCARPAPAKTTEIATSSATSVATTSSHSGSLEVKSDDLVRVKKAKITTTKPDGTKIVREEETTTHRDFDSTSVASTDSASRVETRVETKIVRTTEPASRHLLGVEVGPEWHRTCVFPYKPDRLSVAADVPIGNVLGVDLRAGARVRIQIDDPVQPRKGGPAWADRVDSAGVYVRGEFF